MLEVLFLYLAKPKFPVPALTMHLDALLKQVQMLRMKIELYSKHETAIHGHLSRS